jgi:hypothetical protein
MRQIHVKMDTMEKKNNKIICSVLITIQKKAKPLLGRVRHHGWVGYRVK